MSPRCPVTNKRRYPSIQVARNAAWLIEQNHPGLLLGVYVCPFCDDPHLTRQTNRRTTQIVIPSAHPAEGHA